MMSNETDGALSRRSGEVPGEDVGDWLSKRGAGPAGSRMVTSGPLAARDANILMEKWAECLRGIELLDGIIGSEVSIREAALRTGTSKEDILKMLRMKREELLHRRDALKSVFDLRAGFTLTIEHNGASYTFA